MKSLKYRVGFAFVKYAGSWASMEDILPSIRDTWQLLARQNPQKIDLETFDLHLLSASKLAALVSCDVIVFPNVMTEWIEILRNQFGFTGRFIVYTHGNGTKFFQRLGQDRIPMNTRDLFICASKAEARSVKCCFSNASVKVLPFAVSRLTRFCRPIQATRPEKSHLKVKAQPRRLFYVGRISEQKNLHTLIWAMSILKNKLGPECPRLDIFGGPDFLGSPNMGIKPINYLQWCKKLSRDLGVADLIAFHGFVRRDQLLQHCVRTPHVFISPSLHSDEDFGIAALASLKLGSRCLLSAWGGHLDFEENFGPEQVKLIRVFKSKWGPFLSPVEIANRIKEMLVEVDDPKMWAKAAATFESKYSISAIASQLTGVLKSEVAAKQIESTRHRNQILKALARREGLGQARGVIYSGYDDPKSQKQFLLYGRVESQKRAKKQRGHWEVSPWIQEYRGKEVCRDPRLGDINIPKFHSIRSRNLWLNKLGLAFLNVGDAP